MIVPDTGFSGLSCSQCAGKTLSPTFHAPDADPEHKKQQQSSRPCLQSQWQLCFRSKSVGPDYLSSQIAPEGNPEIRNGRQVVYLGRDLRKHIGEEAKAEQDASVNRLPCANLRLGHAGTCGRWCRTSLSVMPLRNEKSGAFTLFMDWMFVSSPPNKIHILKPWPPMCLYLEQGNK